MSVNSFGELLEHVHHRVVVVKYSKDGVVWNVAVECETCGVVLQDFDNTGIDTSSVELDKYEVQFARILRSVVERGCTTVDELVRVTFALEKKYQSITGEPLPLSLELGLRCSVKNEKFTVSAVLTNKETKRPLTPEAALDWKDRGPVLCALAGLEVQRA